MKINKLTASFGKFNNDTICFHNGLNILYAPNESGKSTWCAFIMAMLYGIDSTARTGANGMPDRQRYAPWSGAPMEGSAELTADKCDITITRTTRLKNAPMREFSAVYTGTSIPVDGLTGTNAGERLTGVSREVFARSAFIGQGAAALTGSPEIEKRIQAILSTGEEETSFSETDERLGKWQRKRKYNKQGTIPETEKKIEQISDAIKTADGVAVRIREAEAELLTQRKECEGLEAEVIGERRQYRKQIFQEIEQARKEAKRLSEEQNKALEELSNRHDELRKSLFGRRRAEEVEAEAETDLERLKELESQSRPGKLWIPALLCFLFALAAAVVYDQGYRYIVVIIAAGVLCAGALVFFVLFIRKSTAVRDAREESYRLLRKYKVTNAEGIILKLDEHHARCVAAQKAAEKEKKLSVAADAAYDKVTELEKRAAGKLDIISGSSKGAQLGRNLAEKREEVSNLSVEIAAEKGKLAVLGDPIVMQSEKIRLEKELAQLQNEYDAIECARKILKEADEEIQSRFTPELGKIAAEYMSFVTGGRYEGVLLNRDFSAMAKTKEDTVARKSDYLSAGTVDLLYFAVRLAVCELALPTGETCPLVIDDALVNMDDERYEQAMKLLGEISKQRQVIFFTCRK